eukprot:6491466-Amphidinium_carterae.5
MLRINNTTTFTEVHQWINNFLNSTYSGKNDEHGTIGTVINNETKVYNNNYDNEYNEQFVIAFNKWIKGKCKGKWNKGQGKGKDKGGKKGDNYHNPKGSGKDKGQQQPVAKETKSYNANSCNGRGQQQQYHQQPPQQPTYKGKGGGKTQYYDNYYNKGAEKKSGVYNIQETTDYNGLTTHNHNQLRNNPAQQQLLGTPSQPQQTAMGMLYEVGTVYDININRQSPRQFKDFWGIIFDTGAAVSVCPMTFAEHIPIIPMAEESRKQYVTVTGEGLTIQGWKETTLIIGTITMQVCFIVANVQFPLIGLSDLNDNKTTIHTGIKPYIEQFGHNEQLHLLGQHLHIAAIALPGLHTPNEIQFDNSIQKRYNRPSTSSLRSSVNKPTVHDS